MLLLHDGRLRRQVVRATLDRHVDVVGDGPTVHRVVPAIFGVTGDDEVDCRVRVRALGHSRGLDNARAGKETQARSSASQLSRRGWGSSKTSRGTGDGPMALGDRP